MLNARKIDKFFLSGGWQHLAKDTEKVAGTGFKGVLDLQFTPADEPGPVRAIEAALSTLGVEYHHIPMWDGPMGQNLEEIFSNAVEILTALEIRYPAPKEFILVKCAGGISRSPAVLAAYFCESRRWRYSEAIAYIRKRDMWNSLAADPNPVFAAFLKRKYGG